MLLEKFSDAISRSSVSSYRLKLVRISKDVTSHEQGRILETVMIRIAQAISIVSYLLTLIDDERPAFPS